MSSISPSGTSSNDAGLLILWGAIDPDTTDDDALNDWWTKEHLPERLRLPGFQRARRYRALESPEYLAWYEVSNVRDMASQEYLEALNKPTPRTKYFMPCLAAMNRSACKFLWSKQMATESAAPGDGPAQYLILVVVRSTSASETLHLLKRQLEGSPIANIGVSQIHLAAEDSNITSAGSSSKSYDGVQFSQRPVRDDGHATGKFMVLFELSLREPATTPAAKHWVADIAKHIGWTELHVEYIKTYELICSMDESEVVSADARLASD